MYLLICLTNGLLLFPSEDFTGTHYPLPRPAVVIGVPGGADEVAEVGVRGGVDPLLRPEGVGGGGGG